MSDACAFSLLHIFNSTTDMRYIPIAVALLATTAVFAQREPDSLRTQQLREVRVSARIENIQRLRQIEGTYLWSGKKNEVISLQNLDANIAEKTPRQVFAKVPGVFVYDMDGTGNQTNISTRGLDPHRGWEYNIRTDGIITNSDMYGYPASHFSLPFEAVGRIELVRGTGALQYGAQFGGMLNYKLKQPDTTKAVGFESLNSIGSYGLLSTYNALGGKVGKVQYYAYYSKRVSNGYRENSESDYDGQGIVLKYTPSAKFSVKAELLRSNYLYQIPGPLTDAMFKADPRQSTRARNYFNPEIYIPSLTADWLISPHTRLQWTVSGVFGERGSVRNDNPATVPDTINTATLTYNARAVDIDRFNSRTTELRLLQDYSLWGQKSVLVAGVQYFNNDLHRRFTPNGGTTGPDYDVSVDPAKGWLRDLHFKTQNVAFFVENKFQISSRFSVTPGLRYEMGDSEMSGTLAYYDPEDLPTTIEHNFPLFGISAEYILSDRQNLYAGWSQAYRPVIFKDIIPGNTFELINKDLENAYGYNLELGWRGAAGGFKWDLSAFRLQYNNRLGSASVDENGTFYVLRTNIGNSMTNGVEIFGEYNFHLTEHLRASVFTSTAYFDAKYEDAQFRVGNENRDIDGNRVESVPEWISRNGLNLKYKDLSVTFQYSYTDNSFADPLNTVEPSATGAVGLVPAYNLLDVNASYRYGNLIFRLSINNLTDVQYFTKRPSFYPGPGIWPSDGRSVVLTVGLKI
ncbi:MAG: TonB-dependent receptor [Haliscomenobacteraceae bacterium CHB4]|nr:Fe(3+) dicitrate transport protein FecA [Saprospiraceae bacterium]MCE7926446.1 TonB-dependent receptor [Haliscomenobacteraceae bacterium CHB4]